jgi:integrase
MCGTSGTGKSSSAEAAANAMAACTSSAFRLGKSARISQSTRTFGDFAKDDWMPVVLPTRKYATQKHYKYMLDVHLVPAFGKRQLRELRRAELQSFLSRKLNGGLSWETVHHFKCGLSKILSAAEEWCCITENVAQKTKLPRRQHGGERAILTPAQVRNLAAGLNEPARSITLLLALTDLRVGELLALRWGSIDLNARLLRVCETVYADISISPKRSAAHEPTRLERRRHKLLPRFVPQILIRRLWYSPRAKDCH